MVFSRVVQFRHDLPVDFIQIGGNLSMETRMHIPEQGQGTTRFQRPGGFWVANLSGNPVKGLGGHHQVECSRAVPATLRSG